MLIKLDPLVENNIKQNDTHRLIRAYEVIVFTKKSLIEWQKTNINDFSNYRFIKIYINPENNFFIVYTERLGARDSNKEINF